MKKILWIVSLLAGSGVFGAQGAAALLKGEGNTCKTLFFGFL